MKTNSNKVPKLAFLNTMALAGMAQKDDGRHIHDRVVEANAALFTESYFSEPLTSYATGFRDTNNIEESLQFYAPKVIVPRRFEFAQATNAEEFYSDGDDDERAIGGDFGKVEYTETKVNAKTINRGLKITVDLDEVADKEGWREQAVAKLMRRLKRNSLRRALALLSTAAVNTAKTWDTTAGKDPDQDIMNELILAATASGVRPNRIGFGDTAFSKRVLAHRAQNSAGGFASASLSPDQIAASLAVDGVHISRERYSTGGAKAEILGNLVLMFMALDAADKEDASNIKRFVSPTIGGGDVRVYEREVNEKLYDIVVEHYELTSITSTLGIRKFTVC